MNPDTGQVYRSPIEQMQALERGESLVQVSESVADLVDDGRKWQRARARRRKARRQMAKASRRKNRR